MATRRGASHLKRWLANRRAKKQSAFKVSSPQASKRRISVKVEGDTPIDNSNDRLQSSSMKFAAHFSLEAVDDERPNERVDGISDVSYKENRSTRFSKRMTTLDES